MNKNCVITYPSGDELYYVYGELHRVNGPAVKYANNTKKWYFYGKLHRIDGAAIIYSFNYSIFYLSDINLSKSEYKLIPILYRMNIIYK